MDLDCIHFLLFRELPHIILPEPTEVCLIVKDLEKGLKVDHEPTTIHFKDILSEKGIDTGITLHFSRLAKRFNVHQLIFFRGDSNSGNI